MGRFSDTCIKSPLYRELQYRENLVRASLNPSYRHSGPIVVQGTNSDSGHGTKIVVLGG